MGLKASPSRLTRLGGRLAPATPAEADRRRDLAASWRAWYRTARWRALRLAALTRDLWRCRRCGVGLTTGRDDPRSAVADHLIPHRGDPALFWDVGNIQALCKACHDGAKQAEERVSW